jgi:thymidylate synthase
MSNNQEFQYLNLINKVLTQGNLRSTRNANTISLFSEKMEFDISDSFPLLTTKKVYFKGVVKELLWFLKGNTNSKELECDKVNIWKGNSSREYLDSIGLHNNTEGDCGPIYGFQWRHFNAKYINSNTDYSGQGIDQLQNIIDLIKNNPKSRRIYMTAWNPCQLS